MRRTIQQCTAYVLWLAAAGGPLTLAAGCDQPRPKCSVARGPFWATYTLTSGSGDCANLRGEILDVQAYSLASASDSLPNPNRTSLGIQPQAITDLLAGAGDVAPSAEDLPYAFGEFRQAEPSADGFCSAPALSVARLRLPEIPEQGEMCMVTPAQPAVDISYEFRNVRVYATAAAYGTQLVADLTYRRDGCVATYKVVGLYPAVSCNAAPPEEPAPMEMVMDDAGTLDASTEAPAEAADAGCPPPAPEPPAPEPMPDDALCEGAGISPEFEVRCDPVMLYCVLGSEPPSLRSE